MESFPAFAFGIEMTNRNKMPMPERVGKFESLQEGLPMTGDVNLKVWISTFKSELKVSFRNLSTKNRAPKFYSYLLKTIHRRKITRKRRPKKWNM